MDDNLLLCNSHPQKGFQCSPGNGWVGVDSKVEEVNLVYDLGQENLGFQLQWYFPNEVDHLEFELEESFGHVIQVSELCWFHIQLDNEYRFRLCKIVRTMQFIMFICRVRLHCKLKR